MDGAEEDGWSSVAPEWAELWGGFADPVRRAVIERTGIGRNSRVLDIGCGSGEFLLLLETLGAVPAGIDPAPGMVELARARAPGADIRVGFAERLPWPDGTFDVVTAFNSLELAGDPSDALAEAARVVVPGGFVAIANWAEGERNDLNVLEAAVAEDADEQLPPDSELRRSGGLENLLRAGGLDVCAAGIVEAVWEAPDDDTLVRGVLLGEDEAGMMAGGPPVIAAAQPFRTVRGGYRLVNALRYGIGRARE